MSQNKDKILKLLANTSIEGRVRPILKRYELAPNYEQLTYHNAKHVASVLNLFEILRKLSGMHFEKSLLEAAELAIAFHDINHSGSPDTVVDDNGQGNIERALSAFRTWRESNKIGEQQAMYVELLIWATRYPQMPHAADCAERKDCVFTHDDIIFFGHDHAFTKVMHMIQDADMLWGTMPGNAEQCMLGLVTERRHAGIDDGEFDILKTLVNQINFIKKYEPLSAAGRVYKNAMFEAATEAWAHVALQYQRQLEAAEVVKNLSDSQVLALAAAMRPAIKQQMLSEVEHNVASAETPEREQD